MIDFFFSSLSEFGIYVFVIIAFYLYICFSSCPVKEKKKITRVAAYGVILHPQDATKILLCRLSLVVEKYAGQWHLPGGGLEFGETPVAAAVREIKEETGLDAEIVRLLDVDSRLIEHEDHYVHAIRFVYEAHVDSDDIRNETGNSTDRCAWISESDFNNIPMTELANKCRSWLVHLKRLKS